MTHRISPAARQDALDAEDRLDREHPGYGPALAEEFEAAVKAVLDQPRLYSPTEDGPPGVETREYFIRRFNYRVIYAVTEDAIVFLAVVHAHSRPGRWRRRLAELD